MVSYTQVQTLAKSGTFRDCVLYELETWKVARFNWLPTRFNCKMWLSALKKCYNGNWTPCYVTAPTKAPSAIKENPVQRVRSLGTPLTLASNRCVKSTKSEKESVSILYAVTHSWPLDSVNVSTAQATDKSSFEASVHSTDRWTVTIGGDLGLEGWGMRGEWGVAWRGRDWRAGGFLTGTESIFNSHHPLIISSYSPRNPKVNIPAISFSSFFPLLSLFPWPSLGRAPSAHSHDGDDIMYK